jgi:phosphohistidine phosphatase
MNLYLIRHALAVEAGSPGYEDDSQRPLTDKGRKKMRMIAKGLLSLGLDFDMIVSSPYVRTRETAKILGDVFKARKKVAFSDNLIPAGDGKKFISEINEKYSVDALAVVGHEPALSTLIGMLAGNDGHIDLSLKKGGVCLLVADDLRQERRATLEWLLPPSVLTGLGDH